MKDKQQYIILSTILVVVVFFFLQRNLKNSNTTVTTNSKGLYTTITQKESCTSCHQYSAGFIPSHNPERIGCVSCHLGNPKGQTKETAHKNMVLIPGDLSNASETCAKCHQGIDYRVKHSLMNTMSGVVSIDKYVFGENSNLDSLYQVHHIGSKTPAEKHLRNKCASCHLGNEKTKTSPIHEKSRGGGCLACHLNYADDAKQIHKNYINSNKTVLPKIHASVSLKITDNHCFGCHSRSGRISTNYEGWHETLLHKDSVTDFENYRILEDNRVFVKKQDDVHHKIGMSCIDCHDTWDVMGTGVAYAHQEDAVTTKCNACHTDNGKYVSFNQLGEDTKRMIRYRKQDTTAHFLWANDKAYYNVIKTEKGKQLITKNTQKKLLIEDDFSNCLRNDAHQTVACSACHTSWAPQCVSCHTSYDTDLGSYDLLAKREVDGAWLEKGKHFKSDFPTLGVRLKNGKKEIITVAPGMIMTLDQSNADSTKTTTFHRLFAPIKAHTIRKETPSCKACHLNPLVLGYGRGKLTLTKKGKWQFEPVFENHQDSLPLDAWIGLLNNDTIAKATRKNVRPFNKLEQEKILQVGACLTCHKENSQVTKNLLINFSETLKKRSKSCIKFN